MTDLVIKRSHTAICTYKEHTTYSHIYLMGAESYTNLYLLQTTDTIAVVCYKVGSYKVGIFCNFPENFLSHEVGI